MSPLRLKSLLWVLVMLCWCGACSPGQSPSPPANSAPAKLPDSLRIEWPDGSVRSLSAAELDRLDKTTVGDLRLLSLISLFPDFAGELIEVTAADGFVKKISGSEANRAYLDPPAWRVVVARESGKTFTVRDVVQVKFVKQANAGSLVLVAAGQQANLSATQLAAAAKNGILSFPELVALAGVSLDGARKVSLVAADDYRAEVTPQELRSGSLRLEGMRCEFPGLSTKVQVRDLVRIEVQ